MVSGCVPRPGPSIIAVAFFINGCMSGMSLVVSFSLVSLWTMKLGEKLATIGNEIWGVAMWMRSAPVLCAASPASAGAPV